MKGGINFEEWKEIVKKNRRSLRSKSNSFKFEPESLTYGAEKAVKSPEYGQIHTITYNVTGMEVPSDWPTEIKSGRTVTLNIEAAEGYGAKNININADYTHENNVITINNVQSNLSISFEYGEVPTMVLMLFDDVMQLYLFTKTFYSGCNIYDTTSNQEELIAFVPSSVDTIVPIYSSHTYKFHVNETLPQDYNQTLDGKPKDYTLSGQDIISRLNNIGGDILFYMSDEILWITPTSISIALCWFEDNYNATSEGFILCADISLWDYILSDQYDPVWLTQQFKGILDGGNNYIDFTTLTVQNGTLSGNVTLRKRSDDSIVTVSNISDSVYSAFINNRRNPLNNFAFDIVKCAGSGADVNTSGTIADNTGIQHLSGDLYVDWGVYYDVLFVLF